MLQLSLMELPYSATMRLLALLLLVPLTANSGEIYTRDGVTDGDTFYLAPGAFANDDAAYQSWVSYSLMKSVCQIEIGGENPARANSFECELKSRRHLVNTWEERRAQDESIADAYLDALSDVHYAGFLAEYTTKYFGRKDWHLPEGLRLAAFRHWQRKHLRGHKPKTRIIGSWNYRRSATK